MAWFSLLQVFFLKKKQPKPKQKTKTLSPVYDARPVLTTLGAGVGEERDLIWMLKKGLKSPAVSRANFLDVELYSLSLSRTKEEATGHLRWAV